MDMKYESDDLGGAVMEPDVYAGGNCDEFRARWMGNVGKEGSVEVGETVDERCPLSAMTRVTVEYPLCPSCGDTADWAMNHDTHEIGECPCGFDWAAGSAAVFVAKRGEELQMRWNR